MVHSCTLLAILYSAAASGNLMYASISRSAHESSDFLILLPVMHDLLPIFYFLNYFEFIF